jgi:hypothetical protein
MVDLGRHSSNAGTLFMSAVFLRRRDIMGWLHGSRGRSLCLLGACGLSGAIACSSSSGGGPSTPAPTAWLGAKQHFVAVGTINGEQIDINLTGDAAKDVMNLWCEREYQVPSDASGNPIYSMGHNSEVRIEVPLTFNGQARKLELALKMHQFQADKPGTVVPVVPRDDNNPPCAATGCTKPGVMWLGWSWINPTDGSLIYKEAAISGSFKLGEFTGSVDSTGLEIMQNTGTVGGFAMGTWSATEKLSVSFDANCTVNDIDNG